MEPQPKRPKSEPQLRVYDWRSDEWLLLDWYNQLVGSGDMAVTFTPDMRYLSNFLTFFRGHVTMGYSADEKGIFFAVWIEPFLAGAFFGLWIRSDKRHTLSALRLTKEAYTEAFKMCTVLIGLCKQEHLREIHEKLGYKRLATIPALWNGEAVDVYAITREQWNAKMGAK
jgi:hypothetical protein